MFCVNITANPKLGKKKTGRFIYTE
uniref:Uncharacterized protein n=1 Tax=Anguilla anguilla TaxID=7936 RepID=A0A0E9RYR0_ANGAN